MSVEFDMQHISNLIAESINERYRQPLPEPQSFEDMLAEFAEQEERFGPPVYRWHASSRVPRGRITRQWDTTGRLHIWANTDDARRVLEDVAHERAERRKKRETQLYAFDLLNDDFLDWACTPVFFWEDVDPASGGAA